MSDSDEPNSALRRRFHRTTKVYALWHFRHKDDKPASGGNSLPPWALVVEPVCNNHSPLLSTHKPRIFVVEDQVVFAMHVADLVEGMGCEPVGPVGSVSAGLSMALHEPLDAALLDIHLIDQSVKPIADILQRRGIPFAFLTAYTRLHLPPAHRARPFLNKPCSDDQLRAAVTTLLAGK